MNSVDLLEESIRLAMDSGFEIRQEWLDESGGGACRIGTRWILFVDLSLPAREQLERVIESLRDFPHVRKDYEISHELRKLLSE